VFAFLQPLVLAVQLAVAFGPGPAAPVVPTTDAAVAEVARVAEAQRRKIAEKRQLARRYDAELAELDRLKRSRASWRRDRQIAERKAASQATARALATIDQELRALGQRLGQRRQVLLAAIDRDLAAGAARAPYLVKLRAEVQGQVVPPARKLVLPDESLDELADPDELAEQIALLERAEGALQKERVLLASREERYGRMARLRAQRERAAELSTPDDEAVRRSGGATRTGGGRGAADESAGDDSVDSAEGDSGSDGGGSPDLDGGDGSGAIPDDGASFVASSVVLADVVDLGTADALRRAGRSNDPKARAAAAARARAQVESRLKALERSRLLIQRHLRKLDR
jgi:hypothetical protein